MGFRPPSGGNVQIAPSGDVAGLADFITITAAITAAHDAGGGRVVLGPYVGMTSSTLWTNSTVLMRSGVDVVGTSKSVRLELANGSNCDVVSSPNFGALTGTGQANLDPATEATGPSRWSLKNLTIDGNRTNQTAGNGVRVYAFNYVLEGLTIENCWDTGLYGEWGQPSNTGLQAFECTWKDLKIRKNGHHGWVHCGPSDGRCDDITIESNRQNTNNAVGVGLWIKGQAGGLQIGKMHVWGLDYTHTWGVVADNSFFASNLEAEGATNGQVLVRGGGTSFDGTVYYLDGQSYTRGCGVQLGDDGTTPGLLASGSSEASDPATKVSFGNACKINVKISGFLGDDTRRAGFRWIKGQGCQVRGIVFAYKIPATTAHANSNGVDVSTWTGGAPGTLSLNKTGYAAGITHLPPNGGTATVATTNGPVTFTYTGMTAGSEYTNPEVLVGCVAQGGPAAGSLIATGGAVAMTIATVGTKMVDLTGYSTTHSDLSIWTGGYTGIPYASIGPPSLSNYGGSFGDGSDGAAVLDGVAAVGWATLTGGNTYTMTRDCFCASLKINAGITLVTSGYYIFGGASVTGPGTIKGDGKSGNADGTAAAAQLGTTIGNAGGAGNTGAGTAGPASASAYSFGGFGGTGGAGSSGAGVAATNPTVPNSAYAKRIASIAAGVLTQGGAPRALGGGAGGSGGTGDGVNKGGGGGAGANVVIIFAQSISNLTVTTVGGAGGAPAAGNCGGGGGGGGGHVLTYSLAAPTSFVTTRTGGAGGAGIGTGGNGAAGSAGNFFSNLVT